MSLLRYVMVAVLTGLLTGATTAEVQAAPKVRLCIIGVDAYTYLRSDRHLRWCGFDTRKFAERLQDYGVVSRDADCTLEFLASGNAEQLVATGPRFDPTRENIMTHLPAFLSKAAEDDTLILYVAMHGGVDRGADGQPPTGYLLPVDFKPSQLAQTGISLQWLKQQLTQETQARKVLLFIDACHSGCIGPEPESNWQTISTRDIAAVFEQKEAPRNIYTLVSCSEKQASAEYEGFKQGIFSYWVCLGMDGAADLNGDMEVKMDELFDFVSIQVPLTASYMKNRQGQRIEQVPQRFLLGSDHNNPTLLRLPSVSSARPGIDRAAAILDSVLENYARSMLVQPGQSRPRVFISEFSDETRLGQRLGSFGAVARGLLEEALMMPRPGGKSPSYSITTQAALLPLLREIRLNSLIPNSMSTLPQTKPGADLLVHGSFLRIKNERQDHLQLKLRVTNLLEGSSIAHLPITFQLNDDTWSLMSDSADIAVDEGSGSPTALTNPPTPTPTPEVTTPQPDPQANPPARIAVTGSPVFQFATRKNIPELTHPLRPRPDQAGKPVDSTLQIAIWQGLPRAEKAQVEWLPEDPANRNQLAFETDQGREIEIHITNPSDTLWRAVIVQIDGLNQIGKNHQLPSEANYWLLPPRGEAMIDQWLEAIPQSADEAETIEVAGEKLLVTAPPDSLAGRQKLFHSLGEIRIQAYATEFVPPGSKAASGDLGIGAGTRAQNQFMLHRDWRIDRNKQLANYLIRYRGPAKL